MPQLAYTKVDSQGKVATMEKLESAGMIDVTIGANCISVPTITRYNVYIFLIRVYAYTIRMVK